MNLESKVEQLATSNRRLWSLLLVLGATNAGLLLLGVRGPGLETDTVKARKFIVVDQHGKARAYFGTGISDDEVDAMRADSSPEAAPETVSYDGARIVMLSPKGHEISLGHRNGRYCAIRCSERTAAGVDRYVEIEPESLSISLAPYGEQKTIRDMAKLASRFNADGTNLEGRLWLWDGDKETFGAP